ncbi:hypothetical protein D3C86_2119190 [compost metagenome]
MDSSGDDGSIKRKYYLWDCRAGCAKNGISHDGRLRDYRDGRDGAERDFGTGQHDQRQCQYDSFQPRRNGRYYTAEADED